MTIPSFFFFKATNESDVTPSPAEGSLVFDDDPWKGKKNNNRRRLALKMQFIFCFVYVSV